MRFALNILAVLVLSATSLFAQYQRDNNTLNLLNNKSKVFKSAFNQNVLSDYLLVNDDLAGGSDQYMPKIARDSQGNFVIVWLDTRSYSSDIFFQRFDNRGFPVGDNQKVNDDYGSGYHGYPSIAMVIASVIAVFPLAFLPQMMLRSSSVCSKVLPLTFTPSIDSSFIFLCCVSALHLLLALRISKHLRAWCWAQLTL